MSDKKKKKYHNVGVVLQGQYGPYLILGNTRAKDEKYNFDVIIRISTPSGEKTYQVKNPLLNLRDPRKQKNKDGSDRKVPDNLLYEVSASEALEEENE